MQGISYNFKSKLILERSRIITFLILVFGLFISYWKIFIPSFSEVTQLMMDIFHLKENQQLEKMLSQEIKQIEDEKLNYQEELIRLNSQTFSERQLSDLYTVIHEVATVNEVYIRRMSPTLLPTDSLSNSLVIDLDISSNYLSIIKFVHVLESQYLFLKIGEIRLLKKNSDCKKLEGQIQLSVAVNKKQ